MSALLGVTDGQQRGTPAWRWVAGALAVAFGVATLAEGGGVLFGDPAARAAAGNVVPFVLGVNIGAGFLYVATGLAVLAGRGWASWLARGLAVATALVFVAFGLHVLGGGAFERKTAVAMTIRTTFWVVQALVLPRLLGAGRPS